MICSKTFLWSLQNSDLSSQQFGIILAKPRCPCVKRSFSILHYTGPVSLDQWEGLNWQNWPMRGEENPFDNCMGWAVTTVTGASSESNSDPFPAWSSHSLLVKLSQKLWPIRGSDSWLSANQRPGNLTPLEPDWAGNDVWDVHCRMGQDCMQGTLQALQWNISVSSLALLRWWPHNCSDAQGENSVGNPRSSGNYKLDAAVKMMLWSQQCFLPMRGLKSGRVPIRSLHPSDPGSNARQSVLATYCKTDADCGTVRRALTQTLEIWAWPGLTSPR